MGTLFIVATPIGNLSDISARAIDTLKGVRTIFAEDTRRTGKLLTHYGIQTKTRQYHEHNVERAIPQVLGELELGDVALVSDSGTPLISDPGFKLVREVMHVGGKIVPIPGASAVISALVASGLPTDKFCFRGFLPKKAGKIQTEFSEISQREETVIYYESPYRILKTIKKITEILGSDRWIAVARELTKVNEEIITGPSKEVYERLGKKPVIRGEIVLLVAKQDFENA